MVCRSTFGNSAITSWATQRSGLREVQVLSLFHEVRNDVPRNTPAPSREEYQAFLESVREQVRSDSSLTPRRRESIDRRLRDGMSQAPDGRTYYAWRTITERATRARAAMDTHFAHVADQHGQTPAEVEAAFNRVADLNRDAGRGAPAAPTIVAFDDTNIPHDRATRYALMCVYHSGTAAAAPDAAGQAARSDALERAQQDAANAVAACPDCGQFTPDDGPHNCPHATTTASTSHETPTPHATTPTPHVVTPSLRHVLDLVRDDSTGDGGFVATDGTRFPIRVDAARHQRQLLMAERQPAPDPNTPFGLREARDRVRRDGHGHYVTSDGRSYGNRQAQAIQHERTLGAGYEPVPFGTIASIEAEQAAGRAVHFADGFWTDARGYMYTDRAEAVSDAFEAGRCGNCGQFSTGDHVCPTPQNPTGTPIAISLPEAQARVTLDADGNWTSTDGLRFANQIHALAHERRSSVGDTHLREYALPGSAAPDSNEAGAGTGERITLAEAIARVTTGPDGAYVTTDGSRFADRIYARAHELNLSEGNTTFLDRALTDGPFSASDGTQFIREADANAHDAGLARARAHDPVIAASNAEALAVLREQLTGSHATRSTPVPRCENCGEFTGERHVCPENADGELRTVYDEHGVGTVQTSTGDTLASWEADLLYGHAARHDEIEAAQVAPPTATSLQALYASQADPDAPDATDATDTGGHPDEIEAPVGVDRPAAPAPSPRVRQRTPLRTYLSGDGSSVNMVNLSQVRADLRQVQIGEHVDLENVAVVITDRDTDNYGIVRSRQYTVSGRPTVTATSARSRRGVDRLQVHAHDTDDHAATERTLRCTCPRYQQYYRCEHTRQAVEHIQALLNDRDAVAVAPQAAVDEARAELRSEFQDSLTSQEQARTDFAATDSGVSYTEDMAAFQADWDAAKARIESGDTTLTYMTENATGGLGARVGGRSFGIEIEVDFPDDMTYTAKNRVAREIYEAGLSQGPQVRGWHWVGRQGGGYTDAPNNWAVEFDRSVDDVGGRRGCEIVSPILYDEPHTWENLAKICEIIQRNGGKATPRTGLHVNVGAADYDHTVENHNRLLNLSTSYEDVLVRVAHNPDAGRQHRGRTYCSASQVPAAGYRRIREAQMYNSHRSMVNLDHVPNEDQRVTSSTRVEVRIFDGTVDPGRMQTDVKVALGMVNAATRGVEPAQAAEPAGTHRGRNTGQNGRMRRLTGDAWTNDTASFRAFADSIFSRAEDKAQLVQAFTASRWQAR